MDGIFMKLSIQRIVFKVVIAVWVILWVNFILRDLCKKGYIDEYRILIGCTTEEKRAHVYGEHFYEFLKFAKNHVPTSAHYEFVGVEDLSLASRRGVYYLYPSVKKENPGFLLVYEMPEFKKEGFHIYATLDRARFILKKD